MTFTLDRLPLLDDRQLSPEFKLSTGDRSENKCFIGILESVSLAGIHLEWFYLKMQILKKTWSLEFRKQCLRPHLAAVVNGLGPRWRLVTSGLLVIWLWNLSNCRFINLDISALLQCHHPSFFASYPIIIIVIITCFLKWTFEWALKCDVASLHTWNV